MGLFFLFVQNIIYALLIRGKVDDFSFFDCSSPFYFLLIEFHYSFSIYLLFLVVIGQWNFFFVPALIPMPLFLHSLSVSLSYILHSCCSHVQVFVKHSCMSSPFPIAILNRTFFLRNEMIEMVENFPVKN